MEIIVTQPHKRRAVLSFGKMEAPCSIGKGGIKKNKAEKIREINKKCRKIDKNLFEL